MSDRLAQTGYEPLAPSTPQGANSSDDERTRNVGESTIGSGIYREPPTTQSGESQDTGAKHLQEMVIDAAAPLFAGPDRERTGDPVHNPIGGSGNLDGKPTL